MSNAFDTLFLIVCKQGLLLTPRTVVFKYRITVLPL